MIAALLLAATLAATADGAARVPGTRLRLGMTEKQVQAQGAFVESPSTEAKGMTARKGELRFFGVLCQATLLFRGGRLARASFTADGVSPQAIAYVEDQLVRQRMWKECTRYDATGHSCVWHGELRIHLETKPARLEARVEPAADLPWESETAPAAEARPGAPEPGARPAPDSTARPVAAPAAATEAPTGAAATGAAPPQAAVAMLPDTFTISLVTKNSPADWPRIVSSPPLEYPDAARRESVQGIVWVQALVAPDGSVEAASVQRGIRELNDAAVTWIRRAKFAPCARDGGPCRFWVRVAVRFTLF
jgi:TonB family protein